MACRPRAGSVPGRMAPRLTISTAAGMRFPSGCAVKRSSKGLSREPFAAAANLSGEPLASGDDAAARRLRSGQGMPGPELRQPLHRRLQPRRIDPLHDRFHARIAALLRERRHCQQDRDQDELHAFLRQSR